MRGVCKVIVMCALLALALGGCANDSRPGNRIGALPYPGVFTLFEAADPENLGEHFFGSPPAFHSEARGIVYTCRAGFIDLVHVRDTIDLAWHFYRLLSQAVIEGDREVKLRAIYPSWFIVTFDWPDEWRADAANCSLPPEADDALIELALQIAWISTTWHEIITWFGYKSTVIIPEHQSAFTYDDTISHAIGIEIARAVMKHPVARDDFNTLVTLALEQRLRDLQVVSPEQMDEAIHLVEGEWWQSGASLKRDIDIGLDDGTIRPWLVRGFSACEERANEGTFAVPPLRDSLGPGGSSIASILIEPWILEADRIRAALPGRPKQIVPHRDFPILMERLREDFTRTLGEGFDAPYTD